MSLYHRYFPCVYGEMRSDLPIEFYHSHYYLVMPMRRWIVRQDRLLQWLQRSSVTTSDCTHSWHRYHLSCLDDSIHLTVTSLQNNNVWLYMLTVQLLSSKFLPGNNAGWSDVMISAKVVLQNCNPSSPVDRLTDNTQRVRQMRSNSILSTKYTFIALSWSITSSLSNEVRQIRTNSTDKSQNVNNCTTYTPKHPNMAVIALITT